MKTINRRRLQMALSVVAFLVTAPCSLVAQGSLPRVKTTTWTDPAIATLMLVESIDHPTARVLLIRRPGDVPNNIILVTRSTTPADLAKAVSALITSRRTQGDFVQREMRAFVTPKAATPRPTSSERRAAADLRRLPLHPSFDVEGIGRGPALVIRLPASKAAVSRRGAGGVRP
jgi:hypothetical protein